MIRKKLTKQGKVPDSLEVGLAKLMEEGFTHVAILSRFGSLRPSFNNSRRACVRVTVPLAAPDDGDKPLRDLETWS